MRIMNFTPPGNNTVAFGENETTKNNSAVSWKKVTSYNGNDINMHERTFVIIKPDGVRRGLVGKSVERFEDKGLKIVGMKLIELSPQKSKKHYEVHKDEPHFKNIVNFLRSGPVVAMVLEGPNAVKTVKGITGPTNPLDDPTGATLRGKYCSTIPNNLIHCSTSIEDAERETANVFKPGELLSVEA